MQKWIACSVFILVSWESPGQPKMDTLRTLQLKDVVVSASRLEEDIARSPVSIEKLNVEGIRQSPGPSFFDAIENIRGVQMITPSMGFKVINTRGFANATNVRFSQLVDGMDNQAPHIGAPIANSFGPNDLDIGKVEIIPGVASALYGMNTINGLANFTTQNPFTHTGFSFQQKIGVNRINSGEGARPFSETSFRFAEKINSRLAFKINGTLQGGTDWVANDQTDISPNANATTGLLGNDNPALDPVNSYGNESPNRRTLSLAGKNYIVARTGYYERDVVDYSMRNLKGDASMHYMLRPTVRIAYVYRFANLDNVYQRANRFQLDNYQLQQHGVSLESNSLQVKAYLTLENTGDSYNARSMAENIDRSYKSDNNWFNDYSGSFNSVLAGGASVAEAHHAARSVADNGRPQPGSSTFNQLIGQLRNINNWDYGAALRVQSRMLHAEGQLNLTEKLLQPFYHRTRISLLAGFDHRSYLIIPDGNYFINPEEPGENLLYQRTGAFIQASRNLLGNKLKVGAALRVDRNDYFEAKWNPRITFVYSPARTHNLRMSFQNGYRFPSLFEAFSNVNSGGVKRVGGLPVMSNGIFENAYLRSSIDVFQAAITYDVNKLGMTKNNAIFKEQGLLVKNDYTYIQPERIQSLEFGYRSMWLDDRLQFDIDFYFNRYSQFIAQVEMNVPKTTNPDSIAFYLADKSKQDRYRMWTNSKTVVYNYGSSMNMKYLLPRNFEFTGNVTFAKLQRKSSNDGLEDGFNTPEWMTNASFGKEKIYRSLGFQATYRWQSNYYWQSFLVSGNVPAYQTIDAQISVQWNKIRFKVGGTNILNQYYRSFLGGPSIGGFYYTSLTINP